MIAMPYHPGDLFEELHRRAKAASEEARQAYRFHPSSYTNAAMHTAMRIEEGLASAICEQERSAELRNASEEAMG